MSEIDDNDDIITKTEHPVFTRDMRKDHTILIPSMLDIHFAIVEQALQSCGYKVEICQNKGPDVVNEGLKYVHNDTCYPALLVIGQFIDNLKHRDDTHNVVLLITQTGGGCRASNYIHLLRKALIKAGFEYVPVMSLNASNLEKDSGLQFTLPLIRTTVAALVYGDLIMYLHNKTRSYEVKKGATQEVVDYWIKKLREQFDHKRGGKWKDVKKNCKEICQDFEKIELDKSVIKPKVGIVGEIYVKYAALGNNDLEEFLVNEGAEVMVPGLFGFLDYSCYNGVYDHLIYGGKRLASLVNKFIIHYIAKRENLMIKCIKENTGFTPMNPFKETKDKNEGVLDRGTKMGEGWLLTAEMVELVEMGYKNIVCTQPFGCLPNHICGKGVMKRIKTLHPEANIVAVDYDPSATRVNQENRIKLMLSVAREHLDDKFTL